MQSVYRVGPFDSLSHSSPMDGFIASVRSGVNEGKVVGFKVKKEPG